jgi:predicted TIM-barrel fold metal-dependent hydrolase
MIAPGACLAELAALGLDEDASRRFLHDNAAAVFGL